MRKKGFPQSYDIVNLINFVSQIKNGAPSTTIPIYSHLIYDIVNNVKKTIANPDILIIEGLNILQNNYQHDLISTRVFISDFIDFSIYIDAPEHLLRKWYINRFLKFCSKNTLYPYSHFYRYSQLSKDKIISIASQLWTDINALNLQKNILPTREKANLILKKDTNHAVNNIQLKYNYN